MAPPGSTKPAIRVIAYDNTTIVDETIERIDQIKPFLNKFRVTWINIVGLGDAATIEQLGRQFDLHSLALEDIVNVHQRPKVERYANHLFIVSQLPMLSTQNNLMTQQVSMFLGNTFLLTFQECEHASFEPVRQRLQANAGRARHLGPDYLAYALLDAVIDSYFPITDIYADRLDELENPLSDAHHSNLVSRTHEVRNDLLLLRRAIRPHREAINELARDLNPLISLETQIYLRDCYDHTVQLIDLLELYREMCSDLRDYHLSLVNIRMNEIMKVLTIIATIFIPLGFIAGFYGMNFDTSSPWNMPELRWKYGYPMAIGLMLTVAFGLTFYFRRKGWLSADTSSTNDPTGPN